MKLLTNPNLILGAGRSGTTMMARFLRNHPDVAAWLEPVHIWRYGHAYRLYDNLTERDVTPRVRRFIVTQFSEFLEESGKSHFVEKTPSNTMRMPFIYEIFPQAKFLHLIRDGRDVAYSASREWLGNRAPDLSASTASTPGGRAREALNTAVSFAKATRWTRSAAIRWHEIPAYMPRLARLFARRAFPRRAYLWGTRFPGIRSVFRKYSLLETCAIQWDVSVRAAIAFGRRLDSKQYLEVKYEDFVRRPDELLAQILSFFEIPVCAELLQNAAETVNPETACRWKQNLSADDLRRVEAHIAPTLAYLGYDV